MSYSSFESGERFTDSLLRARSLSQMAQAVIIILGAGLLSAVYHAANEETVNTLKRIRQRSRIRQMRHEAILMTVLGTELDPELQEFLLYSRNAFDACLVLLANPILTSDERDLVREALIGCARALHD